MSRFKEYMNSLVSQLCKYHIEADYDEYNNITKTLCNADRVVVATMGKGAFAGQKVVHLARSFGLDWQFLSCPEAFHGDIGVIRPGYTDVVLFLSKSGDTAETVGVAQYVKEHLQYEPSPTIAITCDGGVLSKICDFHINFNLEDEGSPYGLAPMNSTVFAMAALNGFLCEVVSYKNITLQDYAKNHPAGSIGGKLNG